jgi:hypothetical protein
MGESAMRSSKVRDEGPFEATQDTLDGTPDPWGYDLEGPGAEDPSWLNSEEELAAKLEELMAKLA